MNRRRPLTPLAAQKNSVPRSVAARSVAARHAPPALAAALALLLGPTPARADEPPGCPPGEWFCDDTSEPGAPDDGYPDATDAPPPQDAPEDDAWLAPPPDAAQGSMDVRRAAPAPIDENAWSEGSGGHLSPWSLALRVQGVMLESGGRGGGLGGVGVSGRYSLNPVVTFDLGLDSIVGSDYNGYDRSELSLSFS